MAGFAYIAVPLSIANAATGLGENFTVTFDTYSFSRACVGSKGEQYGTATFQINPPAAETLTVDPMIRAGAGYTSNDAVANTVFNHGELFRTSGTGQNPQQGAFPANQGDFTTIATNYQVNTSSPGFTFITDATPLTPYIPAGYMPIALLKYQATVDFQTHITNTAFSPSDVNVPGVMAENTTTIGSEVLVSVIGDVTGGAFGNNCRVHVADFFVLELFSAGADAQPNYNVGGSSGTFEVSLWNGPSFVNVNPPAHPVPLVCVPCCFLCLRNMPY